MILYLVLVIISLLVYLKIFKRSVQRIPGDKGKYILVTGCDSGFGRDTAIRLDSLGFSVFATCLTEDGESTLRNSCSKNLDVIRLDITDSSQVKAAYDLVKKTMPSDTGLWSVVNNAGIAIAGPIDWQSLDDMKKVVDVNLWGLIDVTKTFLPLLKKSKGRLVNVASIVGRTSIPNAGAYSLSKFAVEGFTDSLRIEMCKREMKIILIEPGFFKTNMTNRDRLSAQWDKLWSELSDDLKMEYGDEFLEKSKENSITGIVDNLASPNIELVGEAIVDAVTSLNPKTRYVIGCDANFMWVWISRLPTSIGDGLMRFLAKIEKPAQSQN